MYFIYWSFWHLTCFLLGRFAGCNSLNYVALAWCEVQIGPGGQESPQEVLLPSIHRRRIVEELSDKRKIWRRLGDLIAAPSAVGGRRTGPRFSSSLGLSLCGGLPLEASSEYLSPG
jgi:hypothetical protein